jgi:hypothetical protein
MGAGTDGGAVKRKALRKSADKLTAARLLRRQAMMAIDTVGLSDYGQA